MVAQCLRRADAARATAVVCMGRVRALFAGGELPAQWLSLSLLRSMGGGLPICTRSGFLLSKHARELDQLLKGVAGPLGDIVHAG